MMMGFKKLSESESLLIQETKHLADELEKFIELLQENEKVNQEKLTMTVTHFEKGFSAMVKAITNKNIVWL